MNLGSKNLNLLVALEVLLAEANVTRAGDRIGMGQSAMSTSLARLRRHYKDDLLVRVGRDFELTPLARVLLPQVQRAMPLIEQAFDVHTAFDPVDGRRSFSLLLSDYAAIELHTLLGRVQDAAPGVRLELLPLPADPGPVAHEFITHDFFVGPQGVGLLGENTPLFRDHYVCVLDPENPRLRDGVLSWDDFRALPKATASFGTGHPTPADRRLAELGELPRPRACTRGILPLPWVVAGTELVAVVPARLAARVCPISGTVAVEAPFGRVELVEALWWHPTRDSDPGHRWLLEAIRAEVARTEMEQGVLVTYG